MGFIYNIEVSKIKKGAMSMKHIRSFFVLTTIGLLAIATLVDCNDFIAPTEEALEYEGPTIYLDINKSDSVEINLTGATGKATITSLDTVIMKEIGTYGSTPATCDIFLSHAGISVQLAKKKALWKGLTYTFTDDIGSLPAGQSLSSFRNSSPDGSWVLRIQSYDFSILINSACIMMHAR
jgi:hypothetical protein